MFIKSCISRFSSFSLLICYSTYGRLYANVRSFVYELLSFANNRPYVHLQTTLEFFTNIKVFSENIKVDSCRLYWYFYQFASENSIEKHIVLIHPSIRQYVNSCLIISTLSWTFPMKKIQQYSVEDNTVFFSWKIASFSLTCYESSINL